MALDTLLVLPPQAALLLRCLVELGTLLCQEQADMLMTRLVLDFVVHMLVTHTMSDDSGGGVTQLVV